MELSKEYTAAIIQHALAEQPFECCGIIAGSSGNAKQLFRIKNSVDNNRYSYKLDQQELAETLETIEANDWEWLATYYSHITAFAEPSPIDLQEAKRQEEELLKDGKLPPTYHLVVSLINTSSPELMAFRVASGKAEKVAITLPEGEKLPDTAAGEAPAGGSGRTSHCPHCGAAVEEFDSFCGSCGQQIQDSSAYRQTLRREASVAEPKPFASANPIAVSTAIFLAGMAVLLIASVFSTMIEVGLLQRIRDGGTVTLAEADASDTRLVAIGVVFLILFIITAIVFLNWIARVSRNLRALGVTHQRFSPGWAVGWWFIPFMSLVRPYQVMKEISEGSYANPSYEIGSSQSTIVTPILGWWWAAWIIGSVVSNLAVPLISDASIEEVITADILSMAGDAVMFVAAVLAAVLVVQISTRQNQKHRSLQGIGILQ